MVPPTKGHTRRNWVCIILSPLTLSHSTRGACKKHELKDAPRKPTPTYHDNEVHLATSDQKVDRIRAH
jgi:hypothetical protein